MISIDNCPICGSENFIPKLKTRDFTVSKETFQIKKCTQCSLEITSPRPADHDLGKYYLSDEYVSHSNKSSGIFQRAYFLARHYTLKWKWNLVSAYATGNEYLDFGCGTGAFLATLQRHGVNAFGVEPSFAAREIARKSLKADSVFESLDQYQGRANTITLWHVLEHLPDLEESVSKLKSKLRKAGTIFIAVPNPNSWDSTTYAEFWAGYDTPRHLWHFTQPSMQRLLQSSGLKLVTTKPMRLDPFYISLLSEKYKNDGKMTLHGMKSAFINGLKSNQYGKKTGEYSSLIYIARNEQ